MLELTYSPPEVARHFGVKPARVLSWIRSGHLKAIDLSDGKKRSRFRITSSALKEFEEVRAAIPMKATRRNKHRKPDLSRFFGKN